MHNISVRMTCMYCKSRNGNSMALMDGRHGRIQHCWLATVVSLIGYLILTGFSPLFVRHFRHISPKYGDKGNI